MKKGFLILQFIIAFVLSYGQNIVPRSNSSLTVADSRFQATLNMFVPRYADTASANSNIGIDSSGALIYTYDSKSFWYRQNSPKKWMPIGGVALTPTFQETLIAGSGLSQDNTVEGGNFNWTFQNIKVGTTEANDSLLFNINNINKLSIRSDTMRIRGRVRIDEGSLTFKNASFPSALVLMKSDGDVISNLHYSNGSRHVTWNLYGTDPQAAFHWDFSPDRLTITPRLLFGARRYFFGFGDSIMFSFPRWAGSVELAYEAPAVGHAYYWSVPNQFRGYRNGVWHNFLMNDDAVDSMFLNGGEDSLVYTINARRHALTLGGAVGVTPTWEQVMVAGSDLTTSHTSDLGINNWTIRNADVSTLVRMTNGGVAMGDPDGAVNGTFIEANYGTSQVILSNGSATGTLFQIAGYGGAASGSALTLTDPSTGEVGWSPLINIYNSDDTLTADRTVYGGVSNRRIDLSGMSTIFLNSSLTATPTTAANIYASVTSEQSVISYVRPGKDISLTMGNLGLYFGAYLHSSDSLVIEDGGANKTFLKIGNYATAANGYVLSIADITTGRVAWVLPSTNSFYTRDTLQWANVLNYGADRTGTTNSNAAFSAAVATGLPVYVPAGLYLITSGITLANKQVIFGEYGQSAIRTTASTIDIITTGDSSIVANLMFYGTGRGTLPGGTFTLQNAIRIAEDGASILNCFAKSFDGSGFYLYPTSGSKYYNYLQGCYAENCTIGFFDILNSEYAIFNGCQSYACVVNYWDRSAGNNKYIGCTGNYATADGFRLTAGGNGDHGSAVGCSFNHNVNNINVQSCSNGFLFNDCQLWSGAILIGSLSNANKVMITNGFISIATITPTTTTACYVRDNIIGTSVTENATSGTIYVNNNGSSTSYIYYTSAPSSITSAQMLSSMTDETGTGVLVFGTTPTFTTNITTPLILGGTAAGSGITLQSTSGTGTTTGMAMKWVGGTNGATTLAQLNNDGMMSIGLVAPLTNARLFITGSTNTASNYSIFVRNSNADNLFFIENTGSIQYGNSQNSTSTHTFNGLATFGATNTANTTTITFPVVAAQQTSGTAAVGFGVGYGFRHENGSGTNVVVGNISLVSTNVGAGTEADDMTFNLINAGSIAEAMRITSTKRVGIGTAGAPAATLEVTATATTVPMFTVSGSIAPSAGANGILTNLGGAITEAASGTHTLLAGVNITAPIITGGSATVTDASSFYISGATNATVTNGNYAMFVAGGDVRIDGGLITTSVTSSAGTLSLTTATFYVFNGTTTTWSLPTISAANNGRTYIIKNIGSSNITLDVTGGGATIYDTAPVTSITIAAGVSRTIISNSVYWTVN